MIKGVTNPAWVFYVDEEGASEFEEDKVGKWMYFFGDVEFTEKICKEAVENGVVAEAKHSNSPEGGVLFLLKL